MLEINLIDEFYIFLFAINYGLILGVIYDLYRVFRHYSKPKKVLSTIEDFILWLIVTSVFFIFLVNNTDGVIRGYIIVGFLIGYIFYSKIISRYNFPLLIRVFKLILSVFSEIIKIILYPSKKIMNYGGKRIKKVNTLFTRIFNDAKKYCKLTSNKK
ncbi:MAG: spore cortex biosynthesis protein YabQ [Tissierellaceae bacterium]